MNAKSSKKLRQYYRREIKGQFQLIQSLIRDKPRFLPIWLWRKIVYRVLDLQAVIDNDKKK